MSVRLAQLRRIRWAVRATLAFGVLASLSANVLHARNNPISQGIAAWPPLALLLTIELVSRVPMHRRWLAGVRILATTVISGIAAYVSYWHMVGVASRYGETDASPFLLPVSVDGLIVVASISLVELAVRIRSLEDTTAPPASSPVVAPVVPVSRVDSEDGAGTVPTIVPAEPDPVPAVVVFDDEDQAVTDDLIDRARRIAVEHRRATGREITRDQLRAGLRVSNATAGELLHRLRTVGPARRSLVAPAGVTR